VFKEIGQLGDEMKLLAPTLKDTYVQADTCILYSHDNEWVQQQPNQPNKHFNLREHIQLFYNALHDRNIPVDFARPAEDLSKYKLVFAPSLHLLSGGEADRLKLYVQNGGTLVSSFNTALVDAHNMAHDTGYPHPLTHRFCTRHPVFKVPDNVEVSLRQKGDSRVYFLLNHQVSPLRIQFYKPMHDFLTGNTFSGNYDLPPHGVLVLDEHAAPKAEAPAGV